MLPPDKQTMMRKAVNDMRADLDSDRRVREYLLLGNQRSHDQSPWGLLELAGASRSAWLTSSCCR